MLSGGNSLAVSTISAGVEPKFDRPFRVIKNKNIFKSTACERQIAVIALIQKLTATIARGE
ncbi:hypothetical protein D3C76_486370 [compost metagenome]